MCFFQVPDTPKPVFGRGSALDSFGGAFDAPQIPIQLGYPYHGYFSSPKEAEARQKCPGFFLKFLLESPGNLLEICLIKFIDTLAQTLLTAVCCFLAKRVSATV